MRDLLTTQWRSKFATLLIVVLAVASDRANALNDSCKAYHALQQDFKKSAMSELLYKHRDDTTAIPTENAMHMMAFHDSLISSFDTCYKSNPNKFSLAAPSQGGMSTLRQELNRWFLGDLDLTEVQKYRISIFITNIRRQFEARAGVIGLTANEYVTAASTKTIERKNKMDEHPAQKLEPARIEPTPPNPSNSLNSNFPPSITSKIITQVRELEELIQRELSIRARRAGISRQEYAECILESYGDALRGMKKMGMSVKEADFQCMEKATTIENKSSFKLRSAFPGR